VVVRADERVLVDAARAGDLDAFEVLVHRHQAPVYRVALRMLGTAADAEDVAQETFVQAWRSLARFHGNSAFATWLYRIATNRSLDVLAKRRPSEDLDDLQGDSSLDPAAIYAQRERTAGVLDVVQALPPDQRAPLVLREFEGLSYEEIGAVLGISLAAVKGRIHRARLTLIARAGEAP
jgi:RNA polymerase sigma-70 factor (ECF subfamily)